MQGTLDESRRISYDGAVFIPRCSKCGRYVSGDPLITLKGDQVQDDVPNADCAKCGRTTMPFEGWFSEED